MHHISGTPTSPPPHLFPLCTQPKSRKIALITAVRQKGTFVKATWSLHLLMPPLWSHPASGSAVPPRSQPVQPLLFSFPVALQPVALSFSVVRARSPGALPIPNLEPWWFPARLSLTVYLSRSRTAAQNSSPHPGGWECSIEGLLLSSAYCRSLCLPQGEGEVEMGEETQEDESGLLTIHDVTRAHAGIYQCTANNGIAPPASVDVQLVVQCECICSPCRRGTFTCFLDQVFPV